MLLRSASTPVLGSLISSALESPSNLHSLNKSPYHPHQKGSFSFTTISCNSSPISPSIGGGIRRVQSAGNLEGLALCYDDCQNLTQPKKIQPRQKCLMLETIPSFSIANLNGSRRFEEDEDDWSESDDEEEGIQVEAKANLSGRADVGLLNRSWNAGFEGGKGVIGEEIYFTRGLETDDGDTYGGGFGGGGGGGGGGQNGGFHWTGGGDGGDKRGRTEEYYKLMVQQNPGNSLFLRNYAQFLYETKRDYKGAEEYYSRAILADPEDGEILSQYAKLVWESSRDQDKASIYHERAVQASPHDSNVHAAYASFLWGLEEDEDELEMVASYGA